MLDILITVMHVFPLTFSELINILWAHSRQLMIAAQNYCELISFFLNFDFILSVFLEKVTADGHDKYWSLHLTLGERENNCYTTCRCRIRSADINANPYQLFPCTSFLPSLSAERLWKCSLIKMERKNNNCLWRLITRQGGRKTQCETNLMRSEWWRTTCRRVASR